LFEFDVEVSSGTYIRSLIMDIGYKIGCGAVTKKLTRTSIEKFKLEDSIDYDNISYEKLLNPVDYLDIPEIKVKHGYKIENGIHIYVNNVEKFEHSFSKDKLIKIFNENNRFIGFAKTEKTSNFLQTLLKNNPESFERVAKLYKIFNQR
jgi:tRNA pseudouridine55 synthase